MEFTRFHRLSTHFLFYKSLLHKCATNRCDSTFFFERNSRGPGCGGDTGFTDDTRYEIHVEQQRDAQVVGSFPLLQDFAAFVYNQVHQEQTKLWRPSRLFHKSVFQQCTIAPSMQGVTREQFHNDTEHSSRRKVRVAAEDDIQFITASSLR